MCTLRVPPHIASLKIIDHEKEQCRHSNLLPGADASLLQHTFVCERVHVVCTTLSSKCLASCRPWYWYSIQTLLICKQFAHMILTSCTFWYQRTSVEKSAVIYESCAIGGDSHTVNNVKSGCLCKPCKNYFHTKLMCISILCSPKSFFSIRP